MVSTDPSNYATVGTNVTPKLLFNKPLNPIGVNTTYFQLVLNDTYQVIPITVSLSTNGLEVTFTPQIPLLPNTEYRYSNVGGSGGGPIDEDGNYANLSWYYFYTGSGAVSTGPTVIVSPLNLATGIPLNARVIVMVSAPIDPTSWSQNSIQLLNGATPVAGTVSEPNNQELVFTPTNPLAAGITYTVNVNAFTDANGNAVTPSSTSFTTGTAASTGGLTVTSNNIGSWGTTGVSATSPIILTFSQNLDPATVNSNTLEVMVGWQSDAGLAGTYSVNGNQVTFTPTYPYPAGAQIWVGSCNGPTDILGDVLSSSCWNQLLYFYVVTGSNGDTTALQVLSVNPANGATNVRHDLQPSVTFNKSINPNSIWNNNNNFQLYAGQDLQDNGGFTISTDGRTLTFNNGALYNGTTYTIVLPANGITDESGFALANLVTSTFTTASNPATGNGSVQSTNPGNTSGVPTDTLLTLYMNRQVNPSTVAGSLTVTVNGQIYAGTVQATAGGYEIQFTPTAPFPNSATVQWFLAGSVMDVYGDNFYGNSGYFYTAAAAPNPTITQPTVVAVSPVYGSSNVPINAQIDIQYSLPIDPTTLTNSNVTFYNNNPPSAGGYTITQPSPTIVRVTPTAPFNPSTTYYICANSNVKGTNGIATPGGCWTTYFYTTASTTPDTTSGTVKIGPPDGSINVGTNAYIRLQFSKPVDRTTINSTNATITTSGNPIPGTWSYSSDNNSNVIGANFSPVNPLPPSTQITVSVNGLLDYTGNLFNSPTATFTTAATPEYTAPSVTMDFSSWQSGVATNATFSCRYSEAMDPSSVNPSNTYIYSYVNSATIPFTYTWSTDLTSVTMTPTSPLFANSQYIYYCNGAIDLTGNG